LQLEQPNFSPVRPVVGLSRPGLIAQQKAIRCAKARASDLIEVSGAGPWSMTKGVAVEGLV
jgi:hypothetical protein